MSKVLPGAAANERHGFSPYVNNGGTALGVAGADYVILAGDTRMSDGYSICSRNVPKLYNMYARFFFPTVFFAY